MDLNIGDTKRVARRRLIGLTRRHKTLIHGVMLIGIGVSLFVEGAGHADYLFLALAVLVEVE